MRVSRTFAAFTVTAALLVGRPATARSQDAGDKPFVSPMFTDHMVLQRGLRDAIWGWTKPGARVTVTVAGQRSDAVAARDGKWMARVGPFPAGGPFTVAIAGPQHATLNDVLVGDVWICSGQSNMEMGIGNVNNAKEEIASADFPQMRLFTVQKSIADEPRDTVTGRWDVCAPQTVADGGWNGFTAVGYFFGRELHKRLHVPIGLIHTSWGGTIAEAWTSGEALTAMDDFRYAVDEETAKRGKGKPGDNPNVVTVLYNGMVAPLIPYGIKGAIWYQGESNAGRAYQYRTLLPTMIRDWRDRWGEGDFPFLIVQLANWQASKPEPGEDGWAELREAQYMTTQAVPKAGIATAVDIGDAADIHPKNKQEVGRRLALQALAIAYGQKLEDSGPVYRSMRRDGNTIRLSFDHTTGGLVAKDGRLQGFAIAGPDHKWVWADAQLDGKSVVVSSQQVANPVAVRYAWAINPVANLYNGDGLPALPFRTDDWPGVTANAK